MANLNYLLIPIDESIKTQYISTSPLLFDEGNNLIIEVLPDSYRVLDSGIEYEFFEGFSSTAVLLKKSSYRFSIVTHSASNSLGLILSKLANQIIETPGEITPITVNDFLNYSDEYENQGYEPRSCTLKFSAITGTARLLSGNNARPGGYSIEFRQI